jgi:hypothetical protein
MKNNKKTIIITSIVAVCMLMMLPSIHALQEETSKTQDNNFNEKRIPFFQKIKEKGIYNTANYGILFTIIYLVIHFYCVIIEKLFYPPCQDGQWF